MQTLRQYSLGAWLITLAALFSCQPTMTVTQPPLEAPSFTKNFLTESRLRGRFVEAFHMEWQPPSNDSTGIMAYVLLRKTGKDSLFDLFPYSLTIPPEITSFDDDLTQVGFPRDTYSLIMYRVFAIDTFGRASDTSDICSLHLAPQPKLDGITTSSGCFKWVSRNIQGSIVSFVRIWNAQQSLWWESPPKEEFGSENSAVLFTACIADSLLPMSPEKWYLSLYLKANGYEQQSMKVDSFNVR